MEQHQVLHFNGAGDYRLGSLVSTVALEDSSLCWHTLILIIFPLVTALKCLHILDAVPPFSCAVFGTSGLINNLAVIYNARNNPSYPELYFSLDLYTRSLVIVPFIFDLSFSSISLVIPTFFMHLFHSISFQPLSSNFP